MFSHYVYIWFELLPRTILKSSSKTSFQAFFILDS